MVLYTFKVEVKFVHILHQGEKGSGQLKQLFGEAAVAGQSAAGLRMIQPTSGLRDAQFFC